MNTLNNLYRTKLLILIKFMKEAKNVKEFILEFEEFCFFSRSMYETFPYGDVCEPF